MKLSHFFFPWKAIQKVAGTAAPNWIVVCDDLHQPRLCEIISRWVATLSNFEAQPIERTMDKTLSGDTKGRRQVGFPLQAACVKFAAIRWVIQHTGT